MDKAIHHAWRGGLPARIIVVDGSRGDGVSEKVSHVTRRLLDPIPWSVVFYDDEGNCQLRRAASSREQLVDGPDKTVRNSTRRLARIAYNTDGWQKPSGKVGKQDAHGTYTANHGFGHEEWLFRANWLVDGWRYGFLQGVNDRRAPYLGTTLDVTLFTVQPDDRYRLVATINDLEVLSIEQGKAAEAVFRDKGWIDAMRSEVAAIGADAGALGAPDWTENLLNVRFRWDNVDFCPPDTFLPDNKWTRDRHRYRLLYQLHAPDVENIEKFVKGRRARMDAPEARLLFRRGVGPTEYTPEHHKMQARLMAELREKHGHDNVSCEGGCVDVTVETENELIYFEIKTDQQPRSVIRHALGQILEYAYHPSSGAREPDQLVIVGRKELDDDDQKYLARLVDTFSLPIEYKTVSIDLR